MPKWIVIDCDTCSCRLPEECQNNDGIDDDFYEKMHESSYSSREYVKSEKEGMMIYLIDDDYQDPYYAIGKKKHIVRILEPDELEGYSKYNPERPKLWALTRDMTKATYQSILPLLPGEWKVIDLTKEWVCGECSKVSSKKKKIYKKFNYKLCEDCFISENKDQYRALSFVYFIRESHNNYVKIGKSSDVEKRLIGLRTSTPAELLLEIKIPTYHDIQGEKFFHTLLSLKRIRGEWFEIYQDELELLKELNRDLISRGYSLIDILVDSNNIYTGFNSIEEVRTIVQNWIEQNYNTYNSKEKGFIQSYLGS